MPLNTGKNRTRREQFLKLVGIREFYNITRAKMISAANCCVIVAVCATATFAVDTALNTTTVEAQPIETTAATSLLPDQNDPDETDYSDIAFISETDIISETIAASVPSATVTSLADITSETSASTKTSETTAAETTVQTTVQTTEAATEATTAETAEKITEKELYITVYATTTINVRSGPGTEYDVVKNVFAGDAIDVVAETSNGWYKTYNGNYVKKEYTTETKPQATATPKPTQRQSSEEETTRATTTTEARVETPSGDTYTCTITFYGPQLLSDGSYSYSTATGTTCTEGRTVAADWSVFPAGTVIYIENDPLGGDGYYTVEDRGPGVQGYHIDIYADDGESGDYRTCTRTVTVV